MRKRRNPRQPSWEAWYGAKVRIKKPTMGLDEFSGKVGTVIGIEGEYLRIQFDKPVYVRGVGMVRDDLWMPYTVRKIRNPSKQWHQSRVKQLESMGYAGSVHESGHLDEAKYALGVANPGAFWHTTVARKLRMKDYPMQAAEHEYSARVSRRLGIPNPRKLSVPEQHQLRIARDTLKMSDIGAKIMGGPTKAEARQIIKELTGKYPKRRRNPDTGILKGLTPMILIGTAIIVGVALFGRKATET